MPSPTNVRFTDDLDQRVTAHARRTGASKSRVVLRAVDEWLRLQEHPRIAFVTALTGERRARLHAGPEVWTVAEAWLQHPSEDRVVVEVAETLGLSAVEVDAALCYWAEFREEIDDLVVRHREAADAALAAWERRQALA